MMSERVRAGAQVNLLMMSTWKGVLWGMMGLMCEQEDEWGWKTMSGAAGAVGRRLSGMMNMSNMSSMMGNMSMMARRPRIEPQGNPSLGSPTAAPTSRLSLG